MIFVIAIQFNLLGNFDLGGLGGMLTSNETEKVGEHCDGLIIHFD